MRKMFIFLFCLILFIGLIWFFKAPILSYYFSSKLKVDVSIEKIHFGKKSILFENLKIFSKKKESMLFVKRGGVDGLTATTIDRLWLEDIFLKVQCQNLVCTKNNWTDVISSVQQKEESAASEEKVIRKVEIKNLHVEIQEMGALKKVKKMDIGYFQAENLKSNKGFPIQQIIVMIFRNAGLIDYLKGVLEAPTNFLKNFFAPFEN